MEYDQIAHDLAIAQLSGSTLETNELVEEYEKRKTVILEYLTSRTVEPNIIKVMDGPFRR